MKDLMVDIETLDLGTRPAILAVAGVKFDEKDVGDRFFIRLKMERQLQDGRTVSFDTIRFWMEQSPQAVQPSFSNEERREVGALEQYLRIFTADGVRLWAKGPQFDVAALQTLLEERGFKVPWGYRDVRDVRTLEHAADLERAWSSGRVFVEHDPLHDCYLQIERVQECLRRLGRTL